MTLGDAINMVLEAYRLGQPISHDVIDFLEKEVDGPFELWGVQRPEADGAKPERIPVSTRSALEQWRAGADYFDGWPEAMTFNTEEEACEYINKEEELDE